MSVSRLRDVQASVAGNDALENTFKRIGISVDEVQNSNPEQLRAGSPKELEALATLPLLLTSSGAAPQNAQHPQ